jgi:hypothetical protein
MPPISASLESSGMERITCVFGRWRWWHAGRTTATVAEDVIEQHAPDGGIALDDLFSG